MRARLLSRLSAIGLIIALSIFDAKDAAADVTSQAIAPAAPKQFGVVTVTSQGSHTNNSGGVQMVQLINKYRKKGTMGWTQMAGSQGSTLMNGQTVNFTGQFSAVGMFSVIFPAGTDIEIESEIINIMTQGTLGVKMTSTITVAP